MSVFRSVKNWYSELAKPYEESDFIHPESEIKECAESVTVTQSVELDSSVFNGEFNALIPSSIANWWQEMVKPYDEAEFIRMDSPQPVIDSESEQSTKAYMRRVNEMCDHNARVSQRSVSTYVFMPCSRFY
ncbi:hypothetical protein [Pseudoalteromonas xiamenensis]